MSRYQELNNIKTPEGEINFLVKHHPELEEHIEDLKVLISNLTEIILKYDDQIIAYRQDNSFTTAKQKHDKLKGLQEKVSKVSSKAGKIIADELQAAENNMPASNQGNQQREIMAIAANEIKDFWLMALGHKKFIYDNGNRHPDLAKSFADDLKTIIFKKRNITGFNSALSKVSDSRKIK